PPPQPSPTRGEGERQWISAIWYESPLEPKPELFHDELDEGEAQDREGRRPGRLLPRGRTEGRPGAALAARIPDQLADVPQPDPGPGRRVPRGRPGLSRLRTQLHAAARQVRLYVRQPCPGDRRVHRGRRAEEVRPVRAGLRCAGRVPAG